MNKRQLNFTNLFADPPPDLIFEISEDAVSMVHRSNPAAVTTQPLAPGVRSVSPLHDNVLNPDAFAAAVRLLTPVSPKRRRAAVLLPDYCARLAVLDFDKFPEKPEEQLALVKFRMKKTVPFDIEAAAVSYWIQSKDVVVVATPLEIVSRYEAPFRAVNLHTGLVTISCLATLELVEPRGTTVLAKLGARVLTVLVTQNGVVKLVRSLELLEATAAEVAADLFPTLAYIEDHLGAPADKVVLCDFDAFGQDMKEHLAAHLSAELGIPVEQLASRNSGLVGYLKSQLVTA